MLRFFNTNSLKRHGLWSFPDPVRQLMSELDFVWFFQSEPGISDGIIHCSYGFWFVVHLLWHGPLGTRDTGSYAAFGQQSTEVLASWNIVAFVKLPSDFPILCWDSEHDSTVVMFQVYSHMLLRFVHVDPMIVRTTREVWSRVVWDTISPPSIHRSQGEAFKVAWVPVYERLLHFDVFVLWGLRFRCVLLWWHACSNRTY